MQGFQLSKARPRQNSDDINRRKTVGVGTVVNTGSQDAAPLFLRVCLIRSNIHTIFTKVEVQHAHPCACYETHREEWTEPRHLYLRQGPASGLPLLAVLSLSLILIGQSLFAALSLSLFLIDQYFMDLLH